MDPVDAAGRAASDRPAGRRVSPASMARARGEDVAAPTSGDVLAREPAEEWAYLENLRANGFDVGALAQRGLLVGKAAPDDWEIQKWFQGGW